MELFVPEKLIDQRISIQKKNAALKNVSFEAGDEMQQLISRLYRYDDSMVKAAALSLSEKQAGMLAGYLPYNYYGQDETRLFDILRYRLNDNTCRVLYEQWQECFGNSQCNEFMRSLAVSSEESFLDLLRRFGIPKESFIKILDSENIALGFDEELIGTRFEDGEDFDNRLKEHGVVHQSLLDVECKRALLTFCGKSDYLRCSQENLLDIIKTYDMFMLRKFLLNFMKKLSLSELQAYPELAAYLRNVIGHRKSDTFRVFFEGADPDSVQHFIDWINIFKLNIYFDNDERSRFWKQYRFQNVIRYPVSNTLILEFADYVAAEFLGNEKGTIYICEKDVFRKNFYSQLNSLDNNDIRIYFRLHKDQCVEYRNHTARWQAHVGNVISKKHITEKVYI